MAEVKEAKRVITLDDIRFQEKNKALAAIACIPLVGLVLFFVEKDDLYVRYYGAQLFILSLLSPLLTILLIIPCLNLIVLLGCMALWIVCIIKAYNGERIDIPVVSDLAVKAINAF